MFITLSGYTRRMLQDPVHLTVFFMSFFSTCVCRAKRFWCSRMRHSKKKKCISHRRPVPCKLSHYAHANGGRFESLCREEFLFPQHKVHFAVYIHEPLKILIYNESSPQHTHTDQEPEKHVYVLYNLYTRTPILGKYLYFFFSLDVILYSTGMDEFLYILLRWLLSQHPNGGMQHNIIIYRVH